MANLFEEVIRIRDAQVLLSHDRAYVLFLLSTITVVSQESSNILDMLCTILILSFWTIRP